MQLQSMFTRSGKLVAFALVALVAFGCESTNLIGPQNQLEVGTAADNFQFQVSGLDNVTENLSYDWENTGTQASIDISEQLTAGTAIVTITDADGAVVHQEDLSQDNDTDTAVGTAGTWRIDVQFDGSTGTVNFIVQRKT